MKHAKRKKKTARIVEDNSVQRAIRRSELDRQLLRRFVGRFSPGAHVSGDRHVYIRVLSNRIDERLRVMLSHVMQHGMDVLMDKVIDVVRQSKAYDEERIISGRKSVEYE